MHLQKWPQKFDLDLDPELRRRGPCPGRNVDGKTGRALLLLLLLSSPSSSPSSFFSWTYIWVCRSMSSSTSSAGSGKVPAEQRSYACVPRACFFFMDGCVHEKNLTHVHTRPKYASSCPDRSALEKQPARLVSWVSVKDKTVDGWGRQAESVYTWTQH